MAKRPKKLNRERVIEDLKLLAAGATGESVMLDDDYFPTLLAALPPDCLKTFAFAIKDRWFTDATEAARDVCSLMNATAWSTFESLADEIVSARVGADSDASAEG